MKLLTSLVLFFALFPKLVISQTVPVTLHYEPIIDDFTTLRLVGNFNGWNNSDPEMVMTDADNDGVYEITKDFATGVEHMYKFVFDANWSFAWNDPDNPDIKLTDNDNSILNVTDPFITYLLPRGVNTAGNMYLDTTIIGEPIRAIFAYSPGNPIDINSLSVTIDGVPVDNPSQYYIEEKKEFYYQPIVPLAEGEHTVVVSVTSPLGTVEKSSTFKRLPGLVIYKAPVDFYFDEYNTGTSVIQNINNVSLVGNFNNWNELFDPMQDDNSDGLWEVTTYLEKGNYEYKFKLNNSLWINDPDEPKFSINNDNNVFTVVIDSIPSIKLLNPSEGSVYDNDSNSFTLNALLRPGVKSGGIDVNTIIVEHNAVNVNHTFDEETSTLSADIILNEEGYHNLKVSFANKEGLFAEQNYAFGLYSKETGYYYADSRDDEAYIYPQGVDDGSADIISLHIDEVPTHDSLNFIIQMEDITDRTRVAFIISNQVSSSIEDPLSLDILTEDWENEGIFIPIGAPGNIYENSTMENKIWIDIDSVGISDEILKVNPDAISSDNFEFTLSLEFLDSLLGSWTRERNFYLFSYIANEDKSGSGYEVTDAEGGTNDIEDPDVYDAAFFRSGFWQERVMNNYIPDGGRMGPRLVSLNGFQRGKKAFTAADISDSLATYGPAINFLTPSVIYWYEDVTVKGELSDPEISNIIFSFNGVESTESVVNSEFSVPLILEEGENIVFVKATDSKGYQSISRNLVLTYEKDTDPFTTIQAEVNGRSVTLTAEPSSPEDVTFTYYWKDDDEKNPANLFGASADQSVTFNIPQYEGEYYVDLRVRDSNGKYAYARKLIFAEGDSVRVAGNNDHAGWIDDAIFYEIYPRSYSSEGTFKGIENKIPEMLDLGINAVWLMPIYNGPTVHGYEITDYYGFEEDFGTEEDFHDLVTAFHNAGIKVILDFVVNHTSIQHPFMQNVLEFGENSPWADFYIWDGEPGKSNYEYFFDWASLPNLNHTNKDVREYFIKVAKYWVQEFNIDGFRCDVAWGVEERNSDFWQEWRAELKNVKPEVFLQAEASSSQPVYYQNRFDSANDWDLRTDLLGVANRTLAIDILDDELRKVYPSYARPFRFVENHDEVRVASSYDTERSKLMHAILMTSNGVPLIYSGGEVGELTNRGMIDWSDPDNIRPFFKRIIKIRKQFIHNPQLVRITSSIPSDVYAFSAVSDDHIIVTTANFSDESKTFTIDLSNLPNDGSSLYYLSDLLDSTHTEIQIEGLGSVELTLPAQNAGIFHFGIEPVIVAVEDSEIEIIEEFGLNQNYPNPFNPSTKISFQIPQKEHVTLKIYDVIGREVRTLLNKEMKKGKYDIEFNASDLASGIYFYRMSAGNFLATRKLILIK